MSIDFSDFKELGKTKEKVSAIGIGTWQIKDYKKAKEALIYALQLGLNMIDTAELYGFGRAEELVGEVIKEVGKSSAFITTKLLPHHFLTKESVLKAAKNSLKRLGLKTADVILLHWPLPAVPIERQIRNLEAIAEEGLSRYIGVSNFSAEKLKKAIQSTKNHEIVINQVKYSVLDKEPEVELLPLCEREGVTIQAYTPLEKGKVAELETVQLLAKKYGKTPVQIALNYLISHKSVVAIPKTERKERVEEFRGAMGWRLSPEDIELLKSI